MGPALFFSLLIITLSFIPVFALQAQEGRLFSPLAYTKTYAMAAAAGLSVTLVPVLMGYSSAGASRPSAATRSTACSSPPTGRCSPACCARRGSPSRLPRSPPRRCSSRCSASAPSSCRRSYEGDLLYMPSALPGISPGKAAELLQQTDRMIATIPEVKRVFGKIGRADTATDPAPLEMFETTVQLKPQSEWRPGMTLDKLIEELDQLVRVPGLSNIWIPPIRNRIDMLATGMKSPLGIKVLGDNLADIERVAAQIERAVKDLPGVTSALAERVYGGRYVDVKINRAAAARLGLSIDEVQSVVSSAIGGENIAETIEGRRRFPINVRYPREMRDTVDKLRRLPIVTERGAQISLSAVATLEVSDGPPLLRSENARLAGWIYVDIRGRDLGSVVAEAQRAVAEQVELPVGVSIVWSGQFEYLERAKARLAVVVPFVLLIILCCSTSPSAAWTRRCSSCCRCRSR